MLAVLPACGTLLCRQRLRPQQQFACNFIIPSSHHLPDSLLHTNTPPNISRGKDLSSHLLGTTLTKQLNECMLPVWPSEISILPTKVRSFICQFHDLALIKHWTTWALAWIENRDHDNPWFNQIVLTVGHLHNISHFLTFTACVWLWREMRVSAGSWNLRGVGYHWAGLGWAGLASAHYDQNLYSPFSHSPAAAICPWIGPGLLLCK